MCLTRLTRHSALPSVLTVLNILAPTVHADGGGGSSALFSLDRFSANRHNVLPGDILIDDPWYDNTLTVALPAAALRLGENDNLDALCMGRDNGIPSMVDIGNAMNWPFLRYQFSVGRGAVDGFEGYLRLPFEIPAANPIISVRSDAEEQFPDDQAGDVFDNLHPPGTPTWFRDTFVMLEETVHLELVGSPPEPGGTSIDELDALSSNYGAGGGPDDDFNGELDDGLLVYFSVDDPDLNPATGRDAANVFLLEGNNTPGPVPMVYLSRDDFGLQPGDDIDALSVWDPEEDGLFDDEDGVVISLRRGSPSIPFYLDDVLIDEGAIMLFRPDGAGGAVFIDALPGAYVGLAEGDELDALICIDPRDGDPPCMARTGRPVLPLPSLVLDQYYFELPACDYPPPPGCPGAVTWVTINDTRELASWPMVQAISIWATLEGDPVASVTGASPFPGLCGGPPEFPCCGQCYNGSVPPCPPDTAAQIYTCLMDAPDPIFLSAWNLCAGYMTISSLRGAPSGSMTLTVYGAITGPGGEVLELAPATATIRVIADCNGNGVDDPIEAGHGLAGDCNGNETPDDCDIASGVSLDCPLGVWDNTVRAGLSSTGGEGHGGSLYAPSLSGDGRFVVFTSAASDLAADDDNGALDVFLRDRDTDEDELYDEPNAVATILVSRALDGTSGGGTSQVGGALQSGRFISADGQFAVFDSTAPDLVAGDTATRDVFLWDRISGTTKKITPAGTVPNNASFQPAISADGRFVAYASQATNLVLPDGNGLTADIYVWDRLTSAVARVNVTTGGAQADSQTSENPVISADGRFVAYQSRATNLVPSDTNGVSDIFRHDRDADADGVFDEPGAIATIRVSVSSSATQATGSSDGPCISDDGRYVAFRSSAANLVAGDTNGAADIFIRDSLFTTTERVSVTSAGIEANGESLLPAISPDGRYVAFTSLAYNLAGDDDNFAYDIFVHDRVNGRTELVSRSVDGAIGNANSAYAAFSGDNRSLALQSSATNLVSDDENLVSDLFIRVFRDCNGNAQIDRLEAPGVNLCANGVPDECEADCNCNGRGDACEIAMGAVRDLNLNGLPDECEIGRRGDVNCDGPIDFFDIDPFVAALSGQASYEAQFPDCRWLNADCDQDCDVDFFDIDAFVALLGT